MISSPFTSRINSVDKPDPGLKTVEGPGEADEVKGEKSRQGRKGLVDGAALMKPLARGKKVPAHGERAVLRDTTTEKG